MHHTKELESEFRGLLVTATVEYGDADGPTFDCGGNPAYSDMTIETISLEDPEEFSMHLPDLVEEYSDEYFAMCEEFLTTWKKLPDELTKAIWKKWEGDILSHLYEEE
jgi:hypothetical protein